MGCYGMAGQIGQASPAGLSQTVNTKSSDGASAANSAHDFDSSVDVSWQRLPNNRMASG